MKTMRKLLVLVLSVVLVLGMCSSAFAADGDDTYSITITNPTEGHTYTAYQIFKGDLAEKEITEGEGDAQTTTTVKILSNIVWGDHVAVPEDETGYAAMITAINTALELTGEDALAADASASDVAEKLADATVDQLKAFVKVLEGDGTTSYLAASTLVAENGVIDNLAAGYYLVKDTTETLPEGDTYSDFILQVVDDVEVEPKDSTVTVDKQVGDANDSGVAATDDTETSDWDIGDDVPFTLTGTLPSNYTAFNTFTFTFTDTMSAGLTYNEDAVVTVTVAGEEGADPTTQDITSYFTISCTDNVLTIACADLKAADAQNGYLTNSSVITVTFTAELNANAVTTAAGNTNKVLITYSSDPNHDGTGTTPEDEVTVFTYKLNIYKVDDKEQPLPGAGFTLYKLIATTTGEGDSAQTTYAWTAVGSEVTAAASGNDYVATWDGLDDGIYKVVETTTPAGYNTAADVYFEIVAEHSEAADGSASVELTIFDGTFDEESMAWTKGSEYEAVTVSDTTVVETTIVNKAGSVLPSTGGIGTTLFYIIGAILVIGAGVLLIARRRVND